MSLTRPKIAATFLGIALAASPCLAQEPRPKESQVGKQVGQTVDSAVQSLKKGASAATDAIRDQYEKARAGIHNMGVASRVYGRLHWDKHLTNSKIEVDVRQDGVATLTGTVPSATARTEAVDLTRDTVGVTNVVDKLTIGPATPTPAPAPVRTPAAKP